jgi:hypothetical protein
MQCSAAYLASITDWPLYALGTFECTMLQPIPTLAGWAGVARGVHLVHRAVRSERNAARCAPQDLDRAQRCDGDDDDDDDAEEEARTS